MLGDRDELFQVFENLLENACKYGQSGGRVVVSIAGPRPAPSPKSAVTIRDFGPGIAEEHIPRVTERFYRVDGDASRAQKGTGLGLAIVKHILTRHEARLIRSSPESGRGRRLHRHILAVQALRPANRILADGFFIPSCGVALLGWSSSFFRH